MIMRFTDLVNEHYDELNESELLICSYILENTIHVPKMSLIDFAQQSLSSKSSVIRFSQKLGFTGFSELRNFLKWQDYEKILDEQITFKDQVIKDAQKLLTILQESDWTAIYQTIHSIDNIYVITTGITQKNQAAELQRLFLLIGKPLQIIPGDGDSNEFRRILERLSEKDIVFVLSLSGENNRLESIMNRLKIVNSKIVSITSLQNNWLSGKSDYNLYATTSRSPLPKDWWLQTASSFFLLVEAFAFGYMDYKRKQQ
jgi:RpiR family glv operon transcriptional regulator